DAGFLLLRPASGGYHELPATPVEPELYRFVRSRPRTPARAEPRKAQNLESTKICFAFVFLLPKRAVRDRPYRRQPCCQIDASPISLYVIDMRPAIYGRWVLCRRVSHVSACAYPKVVGEKHSRS